MGPTSIRRLVVGATALSAVLLYLDRFCVSLAETYIRQDLELSDQQVSWMFSAFFGTYALAQVPTGWLTDRFGPRRMMTLYILSWSLFTGLMGAAGAAAALIVLRFGIGLGQAGAYPTSAALLSRWVSLSGRGISSAIVSLGGRIGGALAPVVAAWLIIAYVPSSQPALLTVDDVWKPVDMCRRLHDALQLATRESQEDAVSAWLVSRLSAPSKELVIDVVGRARRQALEEKHPGLETQSAVPETLPETIDLPDERWTPLVADINAVFESREFAEENTFERSRLTGKARSWLDDVQADPQSLEPQQRRQLNRLLFESAYPNAFKQLYVAGWRPAMFTFGLLGLPVALFFWIVFRDTPDQHPWCNTAERELIDRGRPPSAAASKVVGGAPLRALVRDYSMWLNCLCQCATNVGWVFLVTWLPRYLEIVHKVPVDRRATMAMIPIAFGFLGMLLGGRWTDWLTVRIGKRWGRALPIAASRFLAMSAYIVCLFDPPVWVAVAAFSMVAFSTDLGVGALWAYVQDVGGRHVGSVLGWGNMWGNLGATVTPPLLIFIVGESSRPNWTAGFTACAIAFLIAGLAGLGIDARREIKEE